MLNVFDTFRSACTLACGFAYTGLFCCPGLGESIVFSVLVRTNFDSSIKLGLSASSNLSIRRIISMIWSE